MAAWKARVSLLTAMQALNMERTIKYLPHFTVACFENLMENSPALRKTAIYTKPVSFFGINYFGEFILRKMSREETNMFTTT